MERSPTCSCLRERLKGSSSKTWPSFRPAKGRGVGKALLLHAEHEARKRGYASLYLYTNEKMSENIALYTRVGYVEYERRQEEGFRRMFLRKTLQREWQLNPSFKRAPDGA
jgi:ribosomal protein S18 acetylase RimI-like enzyme